MLARCAHLLLLAPLIAVFAIVLPAHAPLHAIHSDTAPAHAEDDHESGADSAPESDSDHAGHRCVLCRLARTITVSPPTTLALTIHTPTPHPLPSDSPTPQPAYAPIPFPARAPPQA